MARVFSLIAVLVFVVSPFGALAGKFSFPKGPDSELTPGELCSSPDAYRYPEHIKYCERNVSPQTKNSVIQTYDNALGYSVSQMSRADFKIDHYIPLCMGGANSKENLWPQHKSVYVKTDDLEEKLCRLMSMGRITQQEAVEKITRAKNFLEDVPAIEDDVNSLLRAN